MRWCIDSAKNSEEKQLKLEDYNLTKSDLEPLGCFLSKSTSIKALRLHFLGVDGKLEEQLVKVIARALKVNTSLERLWMHLNVGTQTMTELADGLSENISSL